MAGSIDGLVDGFNDDGMLVVEGVPPGDVVVGNEVVGDIGVGMSVGD